MILKFKHFQHFWRLQSREALKFCRNNVYYGEGNTILTNTLCTVTGMSEVDKLPKMTESPELPGWVKLPGKSKQDTDMSEDDDFIIPSLWSWIENEKFQRQEVGADSVKSDIVDVDKIGETLKNHFKSPDAVVQALDACNIDVSEDLVEKILKRFSCEWIKSYGFLKWVKQQSKFKFSPDLYNLMIDNLGKARNFVVMWELVKEMSHLQGYVTLDTVTLVIRRLAKAGYYEDAVEAMSRMEQFGIPKDTSMVNILIDALVKGGSVERAYDVYLEEKVHIAPNLRTFNMLIHGWCKIRQIEKAKRTIQEMVRHGFAPDPVTYTCLIEAYCREKDFRKVDATLDEMRKKGCTPTVVTYTIVIKSLGHAKEVNKALEIYEKMRESGCVLDANGYGVLINILYNSGRLNDSSDVFEDMSKQGITPDLPTFNTMIRYAAKNLKEEEALTLLKKMEECQCKPDLNTYAPLLKMCCKLKRMKVLSFLLNHMYKNDLSMDLGTYALLIRGLCRIGKHEQACSFFEQLVLKGILPTDTMYTKLVQEFEKKGLHKEKERINQLMIEAKQHTSEDKQHGSSFLGIQSSTRIK
ncbi:pentatricopeptide repeat-containing protein At3g22670, mitochondrial-like [Ipomoea triloba]|uniref:pentatricopeptide repeat-containing protein At3g22670, mitochondrial-like n=1 Tax=Ipomoea triloba TaxID=35885 RepID=UPI00125CF5CF|nr:pentatricopeptide repeat-containing protein At3g22670, mitochondrial-like [Ipomoea triloba]